jgi:hypothetical protein
LIYGNTRAQRDKNGEWHDTSFLRRNLYNQDGDDIIYENWESEFKKQ